MSGLLEKCQTNISMYFFSAQIQGTRLKKDGTLWDKSVPTCKVWLVGIRGYMKLRWGKYYPNSVPTLFGCTSQLLINFSAVTKDPKIKSNLVGKTPKPLWLKKTSKCMSLSVVII